MLYLHLNLIIQRSNFGRRIAGYLSFLSQVKGKNDNQFQKYNACFDRLKLNLG